MSKLKKMLAIMLCGIMIFAFSASALASESLTADDEIAAASTSATGSFYVNGKRYTCSTNFIWSKSSDTLYYGGMYSNTAAETTRTYSLAVKANTTANGYVTYSGSGSTEGTGTLYLRKLVIVKQALDTPNYKSWSGSCKIYYGSTLKWTGVIYG